MGERFTGLRLHPVVCRNYQNDNVGDLSSPGAHSGKGCMTRRIDEGYLFSLIFHLVGTDMLGNATMLFGCEIRFADGIKECGLSMVNVSHERDHRRSTPR